MDGGTMATLLESIGTVLTSAVTWISTVAGVIVEEPTLLLRFALGIGLTGIGLFKSLS